MRLNDVRIAGCLMTLYAATCWLPALGATAPVHRAIPPLPPAVDSQYVRLTTNLQPSARRWMTVEAGKIARSPLSGNEALAVVRSDAVAHFGAQLRTGADQDTVAFVVLTDATRIIRQNAAGLMGETESLRLQMAMDRISKMMTTLSNIEKKMSDTSSSIVQNLK